MRRFYSIILLLLSLFLFSGSASGNEFAKLYHLITNDSDLVEVVDEAIPRARLLLLELLHDTLSYIPEIYITDDLKEFRKLTGRGFPDWGAAAAIPSKERIVIKSPSILRLNKPLEQLLAHEYSHLVLSERTAPSYPPRWFNEGLAMYVSTEWSWEDNLIMGKASVFGTLLPLSEIDRVNHFGSSKAQLAYAQSYLAVQYLLETYSNEATNLFLDRIKEGKGVDSALLVATGSNLADFEREFELYLSKRFNLSSLFVDTMWLWLFLAFVVVIGAILKYSSKRRTYQQWEDEDRFQSKDFDYGDSENPEQPDDEEPWRG